jgi:hypothetical protein
MAEQTTRQVIEVTDARSLYIDLLMKVVGNFIYNDDLDLMRGSGWQLSDAKNDRYTVQNPKAADPAQKYTGLVWPSRAHTMIGFPRLQNLRECVETVIADNVQGDLIETGVWRGGASIFMRGILKAYGITDRKVWVADSFEGLPAPDVEKYPLDASSQLHKFRDLAVSLEQVQENFKRYSLLDDQVRFLKGWFSETLPVAPIGKLALMRLDGDMYESTMDALVNLYPKLSIGGFVIIDDFNVVTTSNDATHDYRQVHGIASPITEIPGAGAFWRKTDNPAIRKDVPKNV